VSVFLLDVNVLVAMAWPTHTSHSRVKRWLARQAGEGWATCPFTQSAFVRILSNPAFSPHALKPLDAAALLHANLSHPAHRFWPNDIPLGAAIRPFQDRIVGHQQVTDAYLLGLTLRKKGKFATMDRAILELAGEAMSQRGIVDLIEE
jgi:uncharacterized protein